MLKLHPSHLEGAYDFLRALPPFNRWRLPSGEEMHFHVSKAVDRHAQYQEWPASWGKNAGHHISVSEKWTTQTNTLVMNIAHEMVHLRVAILGVKNYHTHGATFVRLARQVCKIHGWDFGAF